jgi:hypothetical protein
MVYFSVISGCAVLRNKEKFDLKGTSDCLNHSIFSMIKKNNLTNESFFIEKAIIEVSSNENKQKFLGSLKFETPDKFLISLKSNTGFEVARVFITKDTILINDRVNKKCFSGEAKYVKNKFGIPVSALPLLVGDYIFDNHDVDSSGIREGNVMKFSSGIKGLKVEYIIDCEKNKIQLVKVENNLNVDVMEIAYSDFVKECNSLRPSKIVINDLKRNTTIKISIEKIDSDWKGVLEFIPGNKYELLQLQ